MTQTWRPEINDEVRCIDDSYTGCPERPLIGQVGRVVRYWPEGRKEFNEVIVIKFTACKENNPSKDSHGKAKKVFNEFVSLDRGLYLFYQPANEKWGT